MATRQQIIGTRFRKLVRECWQTYAGEGVVTTYTLYRRQTNTSVSDKGIPINTFTQVVAAEPCTILGIKVQGDHWDIRDEGQHPKKVGEVFTAYADVRPGDNLLLASDSTHYLVEAVSPQGPVWVLTINSDRAQMPDDA